MYYRRSITTRWYSKLGEYKNSTGTFRYIPSKKIAYSYRWYELLKEINGHLVLNVYPYSNSTCKHIHELRAILENTGKTYIELEAPNGLSDIETLKKYHLALKGKDLTHYDKALSLIGIKFTKKAIKEAEKQAFKDKISKLYHNSIKEIQKRKWAVRENESLQSILNNEIAKKKHYYEQKYGIVL